MMFSDLVEGYAITDKGHGNYKLPLLFLVMLVPLILRGAGRLSLDAVASHWLKTQPHPEPVADLVAWGLAGVAVGLPLAMLLPTAGFALAAAGIVMLGLSRILRA